MIIVLGAALAWQAVGWVIAGVAEDRIASLLGAKARVGAVSGLFTRHLRLESVRLNFQNRPGWSLEVDALHLNFSAAPLLQSGARLERVHLVRPVLSLPLGAQSASPPPPSGDPLPAAAKAPQKNIQGAQSPRWPGVLAVTDGAVHLSVGGPEAPLLDCAVSALNLQLDHEGEGHYVAHDLRADLAQGSLSGELALTLGKQPAPRFQVRLSDGDLADFVRGGRMADRGLEGQFSAFIDWRSTPEGPAAAGWVEAERTEVWRLPLFATVLETLDIPERPEDSIRTLRARWHLEADRFGFEELAAIGTPISLYGHGRMTLAGDDLEVGFVPRIAPLDWTERGAGNNPIQALFDAAQGTLMELVITGRLADPKVEMRVVPLITAPLQAFLEAVSG